KSIQIAGAETASAIAHPPIFLHHMTASLIDFLGKIFRVLDQLVERKIAESADIGIPLCQDSHALLALLAPSVVLPPGVLVLDHGVTNHHPNSIGDGDEFELERATVEQER